MVWCVKMLLFEGDLHFDIVDYHQVMLAFLSIAVGHCDDSAVVFHDDRGVSGGVPGRGR